MMCKLKHQKVPELSQEDMPCMMLHQLHSGMCRVHTTSKMIVMMKLRMSREDMQDMNPDLTESDMYQLYKHCMQLHQDSMLQELRSML